MSEQVRVLVVDDDALVRAGPAAQAQSRQVAQARFCSCLLVACELRLRSEQPEQVAR